MAGETVITVVGNLTADPELRFTPSGHAVANFTIASTPRTFDRQSGEWKDGQPLFLRASLWREAAENAAETLTKGMRVIAQGRLSVRNYETKDGRTGTSVELDVDEIGPSLRFASAQVSRNAPRGGGGGFGGGGQQQGGGFGGGAAAGFGAGQSQQSQQSGGWDQSDPWGGRGASSANPGAWNTPGVDDEPPF